LTIPHPGETPLSMRSIALILLALSLGSCASAELDTPDHDSAALEAVLEDIRLGWEQGDGEPFYAHFLDWDGARYFEGGGENVGLEDLVVNHVEPESELGLHLSFSNIQTYFEGTSAWAMVDTDIQLTVPDGRKIHNQGHGTYIFRWVDSAWKVVHTQSASSPVRVADAETDGHSH
jgi:SnoaL-like protein